MGGKSSPFAPETRGGTSQFHKNGVTMMGAGER